MGTEQTREAREGWSTAEWPWDLVGLRWQEAEALLMQQDITYRTVITAPPNRPAGVGDLRVVATRSEQGELLLVLAYRDYFRSSPIAASGPSD